MTNRIDAGRGSGEVFRNHLALRLAGCTAEDIRSNYAEDVVLLCFDGAFRGRKAVRESAKRLASQLPNARFELTSEIVEGPYAFLLWRATADGCDAVDGADSFVIRGGRIVMQSVYYRLEPSLRAVRVLRGATTSRSKRTADGVQRAPLGAKGTQRP